RREIARQVGGGRMDDPRQAGGEIASGLAAPEQELAQGTQKRWHRLLPPPRAGLKLTKEADEIVRFNRVQVPEPGAEAKGQEPLHKADTVTARGLRQSAMGAQVAPIFLT